MPDLIYIYVYKRIKVYDLQLLYIFKACGYIAVLLESVVASEASTEGNITLLRAQYLTVLLLAQGQ